MELPINFNSRPVKEKYLQEGRALKPWFVFGESTSGEFVDVADSEGDVLLSVPKAAAQEIIEARNQFLDVLLKHLT